jgi:AraC-like DNA-binding protein
MNDPGTPTSVMHLLQGWSPFPYFAQKIRLPSDWVDGRFWGTCHTLWTVVDGTMDITRPGLAKVSLRPGMTAIADPGSVVTAPSEAHAIRLVFDIIQRPRARTSDQTTRPDNHTPQPSWHELVGAPLPMPLSGSTHEAALRVATTLAEMRPRSVISVVRATAILSRFLADVVAAVVPDERTPVADGHLATFARHVEHLFMSQATSGITVEMAAQLLGMSPRHLIRRYRSERGETPGRFLQRHRVTLAQDLLRTGISIRDVAAAVGFADAGGLRACFQRHAGATPGRWRDGD